jgi:hypothetical protein
MHVIIVQSTATWTHFSSFAFKTPSTGYIQNPFKLNNPVHMTSGFEVENTQADMR